MTISSSTPSSLTFPDCTQINALIKSAYHSDSWGTAPQEFLSNTKCVSVFLEYFNPLEEPSLSIYKYLSDRTITYPQVFPNWIFQIIFEIELQKHLLIENANDLKSHLVESDDDSLSSLKKQISLQIGINRLMELSEEHLIIERHFTLQKFESQIYDLIFNTPYKRNLKTNENPFLEKIFKTYCMVYEIIMVLQSKNKAHSLISAQIKEKIGNLLYSTSIDYLINIARVLIKKPKILKILQSSISQKIFLELLQTTKLAAILPKKVLTAVKNKNDQIIFLKLVIWGLLKIQLKEKAFEILLLIPDPTVKADLIQKFDFNSPSDNLEELSEASKLACFKTLLDFEKHLKAKNLEESKKILDFMYNQVGPNHFNLFIKIICNLCVEHLVDPNTVLYIISFYKKIKDKIPSFMYLGLFIKAYVLRNLDENLVEQLHVHMKINQSNIVLEDA